MTKLRRSKKLNGGFSLMEMVVYVAILAVILVFVIDTVVAFGSSYRDIAARRSADRAGLDALERMTREIRAATSVNAAQSTLGTSPGTLSLMQISTTTRFYLQNNAIHMVINGAYAGPVTGSSTIVTSLIFTANSTSTATAIKIDMIVNGSAGQTVQAKQFHSTVVLRGS
jgi:Tfp pilus assembly protein PilW